MSSIDGTWVCTAETPVGAQEFTVALRQDGDRFTGQTSGRMGTEPVEGEIDGDTLLWTMRVSYPMPLTLDCRAIVVGDRLEGTVKAGIFGTFPVAGRRQG